MPSSCTSHDRKQRAIFCTLHEHSNLWKRDQVGRRKNGRAFLLRVCVTRVCYISARVYARLCAHERERREGENGRKSGSTGLACPRRVLRRQARLSYAIVMLVARILKVFSTLLFSSNLRRVNPKWKVEPSSTGFVSGFYRIISSPFVQRNLLENVIFKIIA